MPSRRSRPLVRLLLVAEQLSSGDEGSVDLRQHNMEALAKLATAAPDGAYYVPGALDSLWAYSGLLRLTVRK